AGGVYFGGARLYLKDDRWTPNNSFWVSRGREPTSAPLVGEHEADVAIIGGGVTGLSTAVHALLRSPGGRVGVLDGRDGGVATNGYTPKLGIAASRLFPAHTAAAVTGPVPPEVLKDVPDSILVMTSREMYMWGRKAPGRRVLVGAGAEYFYDNGLFHRGDPFLFRALHRCMSKSFPALASYPFQHTWTGPMGCTSDQEPIIGTAGTSGNIIYCGGYTGHGIAMGTKAGSFLAGMLHGEPPPAWMLRRTLEMPV